MRKTLLTIFSLFIVASMVLAGCASPTPETIIQTVEVPGEEVVVTVEVPVTQEVIVEATPQAPAAGEVFERSETLYTSGTQWGPPSSWNPFNTGNYATGTIGLCY